MTYRKLKADFLFDGLQMHGTDNILICDEVGRVQEIVGEQDAGEGIEKFSGILTPGLVNCHCHLELSHLKAVIPENRGLVNFVLDVITMRNSAAEIKESAIRSAETAMYESGIVAVGDICNTEDTVSAKSAGNLAYYNFIELLGWDPGQAGTRFQAALKLAARFQASSSFLVNLSLNPHAPYSVSEELWNLLQSGFPGKTITIHNQESAAENEFFNFGTGDLIKMYAFLKLDVSGFVPPAMNSILYYLSRLQTAARSILVHNTFMSEEDLRKALLLNRNLFFCFCPNANIYIENKLPDIGMVLKSGANVVLGTDSLASNHQLSILEEMKTIKKYLPHIPTSHLLTWATSNGARALGLDAQYGTLKTGEKPGIVLLENTNSTEICERTTSRRIL